MHSTDERKKVWNREIFRHHLEELIGAKDTSGIELLEMIRFLANISETLEEQQSSENDIELTGPRWRLMLRLLGEERMGNMEGITPTVLSQSQQVSKNTISALLRGLEEQGFIQRNLDSKDYRVFRIQLTESGRALIKATAPQRLERLNQMTAGLSVNEREQLGELLDKLRLSILEQACKHKSVGIGG